MPDLAVVAGKPGFHGTHPTTAALVVEVADTTLQTDVTEKAERYATGGIADYWVLDLNGRRLLVFRSPQPIPDGGAAYRDQRILGASDSITPLAAPNSSIRVADLLP
jgi:Uma2 family endonuclease